MATATTKSSIRISPNDYVLMVEKTMKDKGVSRGQAARIVNRDWPGLRDVYVGRRGRN